MSSGRKHGPTATRTELPLGTFRIHSELDSKCNGAIIHSPQRPSPIDQCGNMLYAAPLLNNWRPNIGLCRHFAWRTESSRLVVIYYYTKHMHYEIARQSVCSTIWIDYYLK